MNDYYDDWGSDDEWVRTEEHYKCPACGHVGPALAKVGHELQGEGCMTGYVAIDTGDLRCTECDHETLDELPPALLGEG